MKSFNLSLLLTVFVAASTQWAVAQPQSLDEVLRAVQNEREAVVAANREREERFRREQANQQAQLREVRNQVSAAEAEASRLEDLRNRLDRELEELRAQLAERQGEFGELFGVARAAAADLNEQLTDSLISTQFRNRGEGLVDMAQSDSLPTIEQLEGLWFTLLQEVSEQGKVARFQADVVGNDNRPTSEQVVRIGPFSAFGEGGYLVFSDQTLRYLARQPGGGAVAAAGRVMNHSGPGVVRGMIDPSLGALLGLVIETPTLRERVDQGGWIGYAIIVVAIFGILLAIYRWLVLTLTSMKVRAQMKSSTPSKSNPLGRIMLAYEEHKDEDLATLQLHLDDAVLKEIPNLERGLNLVKVLAAVTPLMGLLGTVIGMIVTFQAITLFGTGDPKLMAGGISQALITTVLGLIAAVPLLLLHAFASGSSRRMGQILEEQSVSLVADAEHQSR
ncbi:MAG: MotA/TolQ/ExbB proton channel family protein [Wenzhouxiangellaceae bacterium]|nr:MotA/TolQ/ExbB proton channel family protein [Wenzhouxiangellaceae bacterium]